MRVTENLIVFSHSGLHTAFSCCEWTSSTDLVSLVEYVCMAGLLTNGENTGALHASVTCDASCGFYGCMCPSTCFRTPASPPYGPIGLKQAANVWRVGPF